MRAAHDQRGLGEISLRPRRAAVGGGLKHAERGKSSTTQELILHSHRRDRGLKLCTFVTVFVTLHLIDTIPEGSEEGTGNGPFKPDANL